MTSRGATLAALAALALGLTCRSKEMEAPAATTTTPTPTTSTPAAAAVPAPAAVARDITVYAKGRTWVRVIQRGDMLTVVTGTDEPIAGFLRGEGGKRKYALARGGGPTLIEVKPRSEAAAGDEREGFKLRGPDGKLLWKVKITDEKIKIADNEEGERAFVVSSKHPDKIKILGPDERELGTVRMHAERKEVVGRDAAGNDVFNVATDLPPALFGVLRLDAVPVRDRAVILAELVARAPAPR